uniref:SWI/SNF complex subunit SWI3A isoform X2 n=1 Tax=Rhizophora mucronata TaxID=61149 RepID=A0A2P2K139_RHIMU
MPDMDTAHRDPNSGATRAGEPELELYTIPSYSSWFTWDDIHETERNALKEFFDGSTITRTPKVYKEYRDFIINKYREDPSRRLTLTEIRKSLIGDVNLLHKVFSFLDKWGLVNFGATSSSRDDWEVEGDTGNVRVEEGAPTGVRVVVTPNSLKPMTLPRVAAETGDVGEIGVKLPPLASYSDVFGELGKRKSFVCGSCGKNCDSSRFEYAKGNYAICANCFKDGNYGENKSKDDFKFNDGIENGANEAVWTEAETLLLLESIVRHGDDWDLVAQNFPTKTKLDCISKLIELPFGDLLLGSAFGRGISTELRESRNGLKQEPLSSSEHHAMKSEDQMHEQTNVHQQNGDAVTESHTLKRRRITSLLDAGDSLMKQVGVTAANPSIWSFLPWFYFCGTISICIWSESL